VRTLAFRLVDDRAWLVTQLARGGSVRGLIARTGALPWGWVAEAVDQVLSALIALHATGVVHRDLKPANLLLRDGGAVHPHLLVGDFGIATWRTVSMTGIGAAIGTPGYLAPEYLDGHQPAPATDLFALGVLAAELLAGRRLVHYSNASPDIPSSWSHTLPLPDAVPAQLAAVLRRLADPDPRRRYVDGTQAREALLAASPPGTRGDLTTVVVPDLLASVPPGWTIAGPEQPTVSMSTTAEPRQEPPPATPAAGKPAVAPSAAGSVGESPTEARYEPPSPIATPAVAESATHMRQQSPAAPPNTTPSTAGDKPTAPPADKTADEPSPGTRHEPDPPTGAEPTHLRQVPPDPTSAATADKPPVPPARTVGEPPIETWHEPPAPAAGSAVAEPPHPRQEPSNATPAATADKPPTAPPARTVGQPPTETRHTPPTATSAEPLTHLRQEPSNATPAATAHTPPTAPPARTVSEPPTETWHEPQTAMSANADPLRQEPPNATPATTADKPPTARPARAGEPLTEARHAPSGPVPRSATSGAAHKPPTEARHDSPATPPRPTPAANGSPSAPAVPRRARRRARRAVLLLLLLILAGGGGTLWWAATHRTISGQPAAAGSTGGDGSSSDWAPVLVEPCSKVERGRERDDGAERCQRTENAAAEQYWVERPPGGFPVSDPAGPFPAEPCTDDGATAYTPVGKKVLCADGTWRITT
jgi:serine/threonine protein kinase